MIIRNGSIIPFIIKGTTAPIKLIKKGYETIFEALGQTFTHAGSPPYILDQTVGLDLIDMQFQGREVSQEARLPEEYQEVEYLQAQRGPYINTGFVANSNTGIDLVFKSINFAQSQYILGSRDTSINYAMNGSSSRTDWDIRLDGAVIYSNIERTDDKMRSVISMTNGTGTWEITNLDTNETKSFAITNRKSTGSLPLGLFCYIAATQQQTISYTHYDLIVYSCKIYDGEVLVRDFVPCFRRNDNVPGMYDLVNNVFYVNEGTDDFIIGNSIQIKKCLLKLKVELETEQKTYGNSTLKNILLTQKVKFIDLASH